MRMVLMRVTVVLTVLLGVNYIAWRWLFSLNLDAWWIAVPLVAAETYSLIDVALFGLTVWKAKTRDAPPPPAADATVDVFIATYNEPIELVMKTARAAQRITFPHQTWILDDGARAEMQEAAEEAGLGYITRGAEWDDRPRHAKAGNINNALAETDGEFILILDADQIPRETILDKTLGYFTDPLVALVQTPQVFVNVPIDDPLGSQAPLFYGPLLQGKDGWNAAFFCGSNAVLRREALMQLGIRGYVDELDRSITSALRAASKVVAKARSHPSMSTPAVAAAIEVVADAIRDARSELDRNVPFGDITYRLHRRVDEAAESIVAVDLASMESDLAEIFALSEVGGFGSTREDYHVDVQNAVAALATRDLSPLNALEAVQAVLRPIAIDRPDEAQPVMPLATISVTEDMATAMRLHTLGWKSVYHHETLADGLAPEDVGTMLIQRLRWAQGTMQVLLRENPLTQRALSIPQRLMYFATMWSYLSGFAAIVYFAAPIVFLVLGILPVDSLAFDFFVRFIPFMIFNQLLFFVAGRGVPTWRGQQYSLALFPVWIKACVTAFQNVALGIPLGFAVTPKTKRESSARQWGLLRPQLVVMVLLVVAIVVGCIRIFVDGAEPIGTGVNVFWAIYDLVVLSVVFKAVLYRGFDSVGRRRARSRRRGGQARRRQPRRGKPRHRQPRHKAVSAGARRSGPTH